MLENILNEPYELIEIDKETNEIKNEIYIYPIIIKDYFKFQILTRLLYVSKGNFSETEIPLLDLIVFHLIDVELTDEQNIINRNDRIKELEQVFSIIIRKEIHFYEDKTHYQFISDDKKSIIHNLNYNEIRTIIMNQNLMFEPKIYKNKLVQEWADSTLNAKMKNQPKIGMEEMLSTISVKTGKHYWDLKEYSIYQIYSDFYRLRKDKNYDTSYAMKLQGVDISIEDFAECLDLYKNPYDSVFVDDGKLDQIKNVCK